MVKKYIKAQKAMTFHSVMAFCKKSDLFSYGINTEQVSISRDAKGDTCLLYTSRCV